MRQGDHKDGAVCAAHRRPLTLMIGPIATNAYGLPSFGDEARTTVPRDASQRPPCRRKPPQTHPQERRWRGPRRTGAADRESCRWSLARQNRSHEQRHDDATSRCYSGKHENCEDSAKEPDVGDLDIERRHWIPPSARGLACVAVAVPDPWAARKRYDKMPRWNIGLWSNHIGLCMMFVDAPSNMFDPWSQRDHRSTKAPARKQRYCLASCMDEHGTDTRL